MVLDHWMRIIRDQDLNAYCSHSVRGEIRPSFFKIVNGASGFFTVSKSESILIQTPSLAVHPPLFDNSSITPFCPRCHKNKFYFPGLLLILMP